MAKKKAAPTAPPVNTPPMGAQRIVWGMPGKPSLPLPKAPLTNKKLLEWFAAQRAACLTRGDFLTAIAAARWAFLGTDDFERVLTLFEKVDLKAGLVYQAPRGPEEPIPSPSRLKRP